MLGSLGEKLTLWLHAPIAQFEPNFARRLFCRVARTSLAFFLFLIFCLLQEKKENKRIQ
jgi:hypothetical protein